MVVFNECRIDKDGKNLIIDADISSLPYYKDVYIKSVTIDTDKTFVEYGPSKDNFVYKHDFVEEDKTTLKNIQLEINHKEMKLDNLNDNMLFVYIEVHGIPTFDTPCSCDNKYYIAVAVNLRPIYNMAMNYIKELEGTCTIPKGFIDMILRLKAFELSIKTGNFSTAIKQWNKLFKNKRVISSNKCGCYGIS